MKSISIPIYSFFIFSIIFLVACASKSNNTVITDLQNTVSLNTPVQNSIVGKWQWAGSATDENKNGIADDKEWKYRNEALEKEYKAFNISLDGLDLNFNADNTGFMGKVLNDSTKFKWTLDAMGLNGTITNDADITTFKFYFGKDGRLINEETGDNTSDFEKKQGLPSHTSTNFEMFKKVK